MSIIDYGKDDVQYIDVDFHNLTQTSTVYSKQYDSETRFIVATVWKDGMPYTISDDWSVTFRATKPDGKGILNSCVIEDGKIIYKMTVQTTTVDGMFDCEFVMTSGQDDEVKVLSCPKFKMRVEATALKEDTIISTDEFSILTDLIEEARKVIENGNNVNEETQELIDKGEALFDSLETSEASRVTAENKRVDNENERISNEDERIAAEQDRDGAEAQRIIAEAERIANEIQRVLKENERIAAETARKTAEQERVANENTRVIAETTRETKEDERQDNELERISNEEERIAAELLRPDYIYLTQAEYDALPESEKLDRNIIYEITDDDGLFPSEIEALVNSTNQAKEDALEAAKEALEAAENANNAANEGLPNIGTAGTYTKVTTDAKGRVVSGIRPTKIADLGITDVYTKTEVDTNVDSKVDKTSVGNLSDLTTTSKTDLVGAVNEVKNQLNNNTCVNVKDFGAVGDGVHDDTDAIQALIDSHNNVSVYFPSGTYNITGLKIPSKAILKGECFQNTKFNFINGSNLDAIGNKSEYANEVIIDNIAIIGGMNNRQNGNGIRLHGNAIRITNVSVESVPESGIVLTTDEDNAVDSTILSMLFNVGVKYCGKHGISVDVADVSIINTFAIANSQKTDATYDGILCNSAVKMTNTHVWGLKDGKGHRYACNVNGANSLILNCHFEGSQVANLKINSYGNLIQNCFLYYPFGTSNIIISGSLNVISNTHITGNKVCVKFEGSVGNCQITDCIYGGMAGDFNGSAGFNKMTGVGIGEKPTDEAVTGYNISDTINVVGAYKNNGTVYNGQTATNGLGFTRANGLDIIESNKAISPNMAFNVFTGETTSVTISDYIAGTMMFYQNSKDSVVTITPPSGVYMNDSLSPYTCQPKERGIMLFLNNNITLFKTS